MNKQFHIVEKTKTFFIISLCIILAGIVLLIYPGLNLGLDFSEGASVSVYMNVTKSDNDSKYVSAYEKAINDWGYSVGNTRITSVDNKTVLQFDLKYTYENATVTSGAFSNLLVDDEGNGLIADLQAYINANTDANGNKIIAESLENGEEFVSKDGIKYTFTSPAAAQSLAVTAIWAIIVAIIAMLIYIAIRFKLSSGISAVIILIHDVIVMLTLTALFGIFGLEVNFTFIAAIITVIGYSINATIIVFDRIKENLVKYEGQGYTDAQIANMSITETIRRTIFTTVTTLVMIVLIAILGVTSIREFALPIIFGLLSGMYSAICLSGCIWVQIRKIGSKMTKNKKKGYAKYAKEKTVKQEA